ncbi:hypothetical protein BFG05_03965 [Campylobacter pinnipediorum subsp. pinnipediorum]|uniref:site-specific integrase n=2 Tax=Campylobacter pinnipediorum TaxID=1965231 RepID=UPI0009954ADA|nr:site-specific integrase [Campylobacter pinnipediorum]OPA77082.1 hypothetical protein BFG05_03965 [Campylobacter pinnipediorum subsp. pinnipediorum]
MSVNKEKNGKCTVYVKYTDWQGKRKAKHKRGFITKREALEWEREFITSKSLDMNMKFETFVDIYMKDKKPRLKLNTFISKQYIIRDKILPYFKDKITSDIKTSDVIKLQNELILFRDEEGKPYSQTYLRTVQNQLSAILNHACRFYGLGSNVSTKVGKIGKARSSEMNFWTKDEFMNFSEVMKNRPKSYYAFQLLFLCSMRVGEVLALTPNDIKLDEKKIIISKSYERIEGKDHIASPKTEKSNRKITIPNFLVDLIKEYMDILYGIKSNERFFSFSGPYLNKEIIRGAEMAGIKRIRVHDFKHSHVAYLIDLGFSPVVIANRLGHESIEITFNYAHLYPSKQIEVPDRLDNEMEE